MSSENEGKIPVKVKEPENSEGRSLINIATGIAKSYITSQFEETKSKAREVKRSVKLLIGLVAGLLALSILSISVIGIAALTWLGQNTAIPESTDILLAGILIGYFGALLAAAIYSKYY